MKDINRTKHTKILVTGGAGFIGANLSARLLQQGHEVRVLDNLQRRGAARNLEWLRSLPCSERLQFVRGDIGDEKAARKVVKGVGVVYHLAAQVAVTTSVQNPRGDFIDNAWGTFNMLEAARLSATQPIFVYASTNKV